MQLSTENSMNQTCLVKKKNIYLFLLILSARFPDGSVKNFNIADI